MIGLQLQMFVEARSICICGNLSEIGDYLSNDQHCPLWSLVEVQTFLEKWMDGCVLLCGGIEGQVRGTCT